MSSDDERRELIERAVKAMSPMVTNETHAWNLWNFLNTTPAFVEAFLLFHGRPQEEQLRELIWSNLEPLLEGPLKLDLNEPEQNAAFVTIVEKFVRELKGLIDS